MNKILTPTLASNFVVILVLITVALVTTYCVVPPSADQQPASAQPATSVNSTEKSGSTTANEAVQATESVSETVSDTVTNSVAVTGTTAPSVTAPSVAPATTTAQPLIVEGLYKDLPVGFTAEGYPFRGSPDAPIVVYEYSDFQCPFCSRYFVQTEPAIDESYVRSGQVRVVFRDFPLVELHPNAPPAHVASLCVADQGAELYWNMHAQLFQTQAQWNSLADPMPYFAELAQKVGAEMTLYDDCIASGQKEALVEQGVNEARSHEFSGTPSFLFVRAATAESFPLVGAQPFDQFSGLIDALIAGETPQTAQADEGNNEIPFWATAEGLAPNPDVPNLNMAGDYYRGNPEAKVVVIEFSDFQCPFCRKHTEETQPTLDEKFVNTDQILWVFKHFPLNIHPQAPAAGIAAECAGDQGKFWEMGHLLFSSVQNWSISEPNPVFEDLAKQLSLDGDKFAACLTDETTAQRVQEDFQAGTPFVRGTPTFIVLYNGKGSIIPGALPVDRFSEILQQVIDGKVE